jgi:hypothetical protein
MAEDEKRLKKIILNFVYRNVSGHSRALVLSFLADYNCVSFYLIIHTCLELKFPATWCMHVYHINIKSNFWFYLSVIPSCSRVFVKSYVNRGVPTRYATGTSYNINYLWKYISCARSHQERNSVALEHTTVTFNL